MRALLLNMMVIPLFSVAPPASAQVSHAEWNRILKEYVSASGRVNYEKLKNHQDVLDHYLKQLSANAPQPGWSIDERKAYWINAYNAFTISLILQHYPVRTIKDIGGIFTSPWAIEFITIGREKYTLDRIEHDILRKEFNDPRIHFAIVCASRSCPVLLNRAYDPLELDHQLNEQARGFLSDPSRNKIASSAVEISRIFDWFKGDFTTRGTLIQFLNRYSSVPINSNASISYLDYDWSLNE